MHGLFFCYLPLFRRPLSIVRFGACAFVRCSPSHNVSTISNNFSLKHCLCYLTSRVREWCQTFSYLIIITWTIILLTTISTCILISILNSIILYLNNIKFNLQFHHIYSPPHDLYFCTMCIFIHTYSNNVTLRVRNCVIILLFRCSSLVSNLPNPDRCRLVQDPLNPCCSVPYCDFSNPTPIFPTPVVTPTTGPDGSVDFSTLPPASGSKPPGKREREQLCKSK